jgi:hypothetical protein
MNVWRLVVGGCTGILIACASPSQAGTPAQAATPPEKGVRVPSEALPLAATKTKAEGEGFVLEVVPPASVAVNGEGVARLLLKPKAGYHVNKDFPTSLDVTAPAGVELKKAKQTGADAAKLDESQAAFDISFKGKAPGTHSFAATFKFAVCTATTCDPKREKLTWEVAVK